MNSTSNIILFLSLLYSFLSYSQTQPIFQKIDQSQGLSSSRVTGIVKEKEGFVWISTQYGLNRYDGFQVKTFNKQNSTIPTNDIAGLFLDSQNKLWLNTYGKGLVLYDKETSQFITYKHDEKDKYSLISNRVNTLIEGSDQNLWIGTEKGLALLDIEEEKFYHFTPTSNISLNITALYDDSKGNIILGTSSSGLFRFNKLNKTFTSIYNKISTSINVIIPLSSNRLLFATSGSGLKVYNMNNDRISDFLENQKEFTEKTKIVRSLEKDSKGHLWIGTDGFGLFELKETDLKNPIIENYTKNAQQSFSISGNAIYAISEDEDGHIWIGTAWNGINVLQNNRETEIIFSDFKGTDPNPILSISQDERYLYLGLDGTGLNIYDKKNNSALFFNESILKAKYIQKIMPSSQGNIWLGTFNNGLLKLNLNDTKAEKYINDTDDKNSLSFNDVRDIVEDDDKNLWIATWGGGLNHFDTSSKQFKSYDVSNNNLISLLKIEDNIWTTSYGGGLSVFNTLTKSTETFLYSESDTNTLSSNNLFSILKDNKGKLWIGTSGEGINRMDLKSKKIERFENVENIRYKTITSMVEDDDHNIWFGSKSGIIKYDYDSDTFNTFSSLTGDFHINSVHKDSKGFLYFGGLKGVIKFHPANMKDDKKHPKVILNDFKIFNKEIAIKEGSILPKNIAFLDTIILEYDHDVITFEFSALKYPFSKNCEYAIQLENFDENWRNIGKDRTATYTNLSPGEYTFKVKSKATGYNWGDEYSSINMLIKKPFWLTWWAFTFYFILFLLFLYVYRKLTISWTNLKNNLALEKVTHQKDTELYTLKQQFFTTISHEIRTPVTLILSSINRLFETDELSGSKQFKAAHTIRRNSNLLLRLVNELLDIRKLETNEISLNVSENDIISYVKEIYLSFSDIAKDRNIDYKFKSDEQRVFIWFDRAQLEKVIFNLLSNAFKFTKDNGAIKLNLVSEMDSVYIRIKDDGTGISTEHQKKIFSKYYQVKGDDTKRGFGLGLSIAKDIVKLHKGNISVYSQLNEGSLFEIKLLKGNAHFKISSKQTKISTKNTLIHKELKQKIDKSKKKSILIVEDNKNIQDALKDLLEQHNYEVQQALNGLEGLKKATLYLPDVILSDLMMPEMGGLEMAKKIKVNSITSHIPIIVLSAKTELDNQLEGFEAGIDEYITKPYNETFLIQRIKNLIDSRKQLKKLYGNYTNSNPKQTNISSQDELFLEKLYTLFEENLQSEDLKAEVIAKKMNMSHSALYKKIKTLTGLTYMQLVRDYKLSIAKQLIEEMGYSVSEACYKVGYSDRKYFSKLFKNKFKKNPSEFLNP